MLQKFVEQILRGLGNEVHEEGATLRTTSARGQFVIAFVTEGELDEFLELSRGVEGTRIVVPMYPLSPDDRKILALLEVVEWPQTEVEDEALAVMLGRRSAADSLFGRL